MARNPMKDKLAIIGIGSSAYGRDLHQTPLALGLEAARKAIEQAGLTKKDIDGICGSGEGYHSKGPNFLALQEALGIERVTWVSGGTLGRNLLDTAHAVFSGACEIALIVSVGQRLGGSSVSARNDPYRARAAKFGGRHRTADVAMRWSHSAEPYAAWAHRYMYEYKAPREVFGYVAVNNRTGATKNPNAIMRKPITMEDHLSARMIRSPLGLLDCDLPCDCGEAMIVTTADVAKSLPKKPVYIHAATFGETGSGGEAYENGRHWTATAPWVAMDQIWKKSDVGIDDIDLFYPYDGFTPITVAFTEAAGFAKPGQAYGLYRDSWIETEQRLKLRGRTYVQTGGGSMSQGRLGGFNYYTEAVTQLRGEAGARQIPNAKVALIGIGSFYHDPTAVVLRAD